MAERLLAQADLPTEAAAANTLIARMRGRAAEILAHRMFPRDEP